jgi:PST family polysaccharide transporter
MSKVSSNIAWLMLVQCSGYIFPLIMLPYLVRTLGGGNFGVYAISLAVIQYGVMITEFGFNFSATRKVSLNRTNRKTLSKIFIETIYAKLFLFIVFAVSVGLYLIYNNQIIEYENIYFAGLITIFSNALFPIWYFQGIEKVKIISIITAVSRCFTLIMTFLFVKDDTDLDAALLVNSFLYFLPALAGCMLVFLSKDITIVKISFNDIYICMKESFPLFISNVSISLYSTFNTIILGKYASSIVVGNYAAADKLRLAVQGLYAPIQQAVFPRASQIVSEKDGVNKIIKKFGVPFMLFGFLISLSFLLLGDFAVRIYFGDEYSLAGELFTLMFPLPLIISIATVFTHWVLIAQGMNKLIGKVYSFFSLLHISYVVFFIKYIGVQGMVYSVILTQSLITCTMLYFALKNVRKRKCDVNNT